MSGPWRAVLLMLVASLMLHGCTPTDGPDRPAAKAEPATSEDRRQFVADSSIQLPPAWSYMVSRQAAETQEGGSWLFTISPFSFNLGRRCDRETGPLVGSLFRRAEVFITGGVYVADFPPSANLYKQTPGQFSLEHDKDEYAATFSLREGFCRPTYRIDFELDDYYVSLHVAVHKKAQEATIEAALDVLNSIR